MEESTERKHLQIWNWSKAGALNPRLRKMSFFIKFFFLKFNAKAPTKQTVKTFIISTTILMKFKNYNIREEA